MGGSEIRVLHCVNRIGINRANLQNLPMLYTEPAPQRVFF